MRDLPTVVLDTTLADLYGKGNPKDGSRIGQVLCGTNSGIALNPDFARNVKFLYQDASFNEMPKEELTEENEDLRKELATKMLSLVPQRDAFVSGNTPVVFFNLNQSEKQIAHDKKEAETTLKNMDPSQKPQLIFVPGPEKISLEEHHIDLLAYKVALDQLEDYPTTVPLEKHWFLNSKVALAQSGLPTPKCDLIEIDGISSTAKDCCSACSSSKDALYIFPDCTGSRGKWLSSQLSRITSAISSRSLPFVVKNQQTFGGGGTYVVSDEKDRKKLLDNISNGLLTKLLSQITSTNEHLKPGTVLISEMVTDPIGDYGVTFFLTKSGDCIFLSAAEQMTDPNKAWIGSNISYKHQPSLEEKFSPIMKEIGSWLHKNSYYGPIGADILETEEGKGPKNGFPKQFENFNIVDLNVRTSGSLVLPLLKTHFSEKRELHNASSFSITVKMGREKFIEKWGKEFEEGSMCIVSWYEDLNDGVSMADIAIGAKDEEALQKYMETVREGTEEVHM